MRRYQRLPGSLLPVCGIGVRSIDVIRKLPRLNLFLATDALMGLLGYMAIYRDKRLENGCFL